MAQIVINLDLNNNQKYYKGDSLDIEINANTSIAGWEIRAQISDETGNISKLASANVTGGSTNQITIDDESDGTFTLHFASGETTNFDDDVTLEVERTDSSDKVRTIFQGKFNLGDENIIWTEIS